MAIVLLGLAMWAFSYFIFLGKILPLRSEKHEAGRLFVEDEAALKKHTVTASVLFVLGALMIGGALVLLL